MKSHRIKEIITRKIQHKNKTKTQKPADAGKMCGVWGQCADEEGCWSNKEADEDRAEAGRMRGLTMEDIFGGGGTMAESGNQRWWQV
jgi:hypothetical protein